MKPVTLSIFDATARPCPACDPSASRRITPRHITNIPYAFCARCSAVNGDGKECRLCRCNLPLRCFRVASRNQDNRSDICYVCLAAKYLEAENTGKRYCTKCAAMKLPENMGDQYCKACVNMMSAKNRQNKNSKEYRTNYHFMRTYGIDISIYKDMIAAQDGKCAICQRSEPEGYKGPRRFLCVDHCHATGKVRQLLCAHCNHALGSLRDDPELLSRAREYLLRHMDEEH